MRTCEDHRSSWYMVVLSRPSILSLDLEISVDIDTERRFCEEEREGFWRITLLTKNLETFLV